MGKRLRVVGIGGKDVTLQKETLIIHPYCVVFRYGFRKGVQSPAGGDTLYWMVMIYSTVPTPWVDLYCPWVL